MHQKDHLSIKLMKGFSWGHSIFSMAFEVNNLRKQVVEESIHVKFDEDYYTKYYIDHSGSILDELISYSSPESHVYGVSFASFILISSNY